jgi:DNA invertase Pin-like site-specific DNA recombinase
MFYVSYLRVSTSRQGISGLGLEAQRDAVGRYIATNGGQLTAEFLEVETGKGSNALQTRPQLRVALAHAQKTRATLVVAKLDRLTRSARLLLEMMERSGGLDIVFCDLPQIPPGPIGRFMITQLAAVAELEAGMISDRTKAALAAAKARGVQLGKNGKVLAERRKSDALDHALSVAHEFAAAQQAGCSTLRDIAAHLQESGVKPRDGGQWHPTTVKRTMARLAALKIPQMQPSSAPQHDLH